MPDVTGGKSLPALEILNHWREVRALRIGRALGLIGGLLAALATVSDVAFDNTTLVPTDLMLVAGCALTWHWAAARKRAGYFWLPLYVSYFVASIPTYATTGGICGPFLGIGVSLLYILGEMLDARRHSLFHLTLAALHIPAFLILEYTYPLAPEPVIPPMFAAIITALNFAAVAFCVRSFLETEADLAGEFASRQEEIQEAQSIAKVGSWSWNIEKDTITWSDELFKMFDVSKEDFDPSYKAYLARLSPAQRDFVNNVIETSTRGGQEFTFEHTVPRPGGDRHIFARGRVVHDANGRAVGMVGTSQDITERKAIEAELLRAREALEKRVEERTLQLEESLAREKEAKEQAERASQAKMQFLANMSHEIRTPLNSILGFSELLGSQEHGPEQAREFMARIKANGEQLLRLIDDILDLSKFEAGRIPIEKSPVDLRELLNGIADSFQPSLDAKGLQLRLELAPGLPGQLLLDGTRVRQVLMNLAGNAIKFSETGTVRITAAQSGGRLSLGVIDMGIGIPEERRAGLFQLFSQGDSSVARRFGGSGLGLALSRRIAQAMGGDLRLESSTPGQGSHFVFEVPFEPAPAAPQVKAETDEAGHDSEPVPQACTGPRKILLAEDSPDNAFLICHYIKPLGHTVDLVTNGLEAVEAAARTRYDAILMDIQMPGMDGLEATRRIRASGYSGPIFALTAHALPAEAERSRSAGCDLHLTKPISGADLQRELNKRLSTQKV